MSRRSERNAPITSIPRLPMNPARQGDSVRRQRRPVDPAHGPTTSIPQYSGCWMQVSGWSVTFMLLVGDDLATTTRYAPTEPKVRGSNPRARGEHTPAVVSDNGPCYKSYGFARYIAFAARTHPRPHALPQPDRVSDHRVRASEHGAE
jgi:hypothetical protein